MLQCSWDPAVVAGCRQTSRSWRMGFPGSVQIFLAVTGLFLVVVSQSLCNEQQVIGESGHVCAWGQQWSLWSLHSGPHKVIWGNSNAF